MSTIAAWSYTQDLTVWPASSYDAYSQPSFGTPYLITGSWAAGGDMQTDDKGNEFAPSSRYFFELADGSASMPQREGYIMRGDHTATSSPITAGAEQIKKVSGFDMAMFGASELPDWIVYT